MSGGETAPSVAIIGAGFSGIAMAIALREAGHDRVAIYERGPELGGVWRENTYPGATCDVPSYLYSYSFAQRHDWSKPCSPQPEILAYLHDVARKHGVDALVQTDTEITSATFDEDALCWELRTAAGERHTADVLIPACGQLVHPAWPDVPGRERFAGPSFHSAEWDHTVSLEGKRVGVIGTGASSIQLVPPVAEHAAELQLFQRSAPYMLPRANEAYPTWMHTLIDRVPGLQAARRGALRLLMEAIVAGLSTHRTAGRWLGAWAWSYRRLRVRDPELRRRLTPDYPIGCKRILFSSAYYPALQRPNVELVTDDIRAITERGVLTADGQERELDVLIYGTGFHAGDFVAPMAVHGTGGRELSEVWRDGAEAHLGLTVPGFPNLFLMYGPNTNLGVGSIIVMIEAQTRYVIDALHHLHGTDAAALDVRPEVQRRSGDALQERLKTSVWTSCQSWYRKDGDGRITNNWPGFMREYEQRTRTLDPAEYVWLRRSQAAAAATAAAPSGESALR